LELAEAFYKYRKEYSLSLEQLARIVGLSRTTIIDYERLYSALTLSVKNYLKSGRLDFRPASTIARIEDPNRQTELANIAVEKDLTLHTIEKIVPTVKSQPDRSVADIVDAVISGKAKAEEMARAEAAKRAAGITLETPEELKQGAEALKKEAERKAKEAMTAEEKVALEAAREAERQAKLERQQQVAGEKRQREEAERKRLEERVRRQIEAETREKVEEELLIRSDFVQKAIDKQAEIAIAKGEEEMITEKEGEPIVSQAEIIEAMAEAEESDFTFKLESDLYNLAKSRQFAPKEVVDKLPEERLKSLERELPGYIQFLEQLLSIIREKLEIRRW